jgi:alpha-tubulin suppressor-like RCC1 family protein
MRSGFRRGLTGLGMISIVLLASCGQGSNAGPSGRLEDTATLTLWALPPAFTQTLTASVTFTPSQDVSATPTALSAQSVAFVPIAAGGNHTCAITPGGGVMCWGSNDNGQLGDGSRTDRTRPVSVKNLAVRAVAVTAGWTHTCILTEEGGVKCWGRNKNGELGDGTTQRSSEPVDVSGLKSGVIAIAAGDDHTCAVTAQGGVKCWGYNNFGQLGDGTTETRNSPVDVLKLGGEATAVAAGTAHSCALTSESEVMCWGSNDTGQLGDGSDAASRGTPGVVSGLKGGIASMTAKGGHTCILNGAGEILCWGWNKYGQLGDASHDDRSAPVPVTGWEGSAILIAAGWGQTCGALNDGSLKCWGWNFYGQLGEGSMANRNQPVAVQGLKGKVFAVAGGGGHTCAILEGGELFCWGLNKNGQLGNQTTLDSSLPVKVGGVIGSVSA